jgi:phage terminase Nu1 subunit (DNA packaging protein)
MPKAGHGDTMTTGLPLAQAAKRLGKHRSTLSKWLQRGAPCLEEGRSGRGYSAIVDLDALQRWRARKVAPGLAQRNDEEMLVLIARSFSDALKRDRAHSRVEIEEATAAGFLALVFERIWMNLTMRPRHEIVLPPEITQLCTLWVESREQQHGRI